MAASFAHGLSAVECGRAAAVAGRSQRHMTEWAAAYPALFSAKPFDAALYGTVAMAMAFSGPRHTAEELRTANKACLWAFALDWLIDYALTSAEEVRGHARVCLEVAAGEGPPPGDDLARMLADIRAGLAGAPAWPAMEDIWQDELRRTLEAMVREWDWKAAHATPSLEEYLANADNHAFSLVFTCHWIATGGQDAPMAAQQVREAARAVQRVMRLLNDLSSYERDRSWGDVNALLIGATREEVGDRVAVLTAEAGKLIGGVRDVHPRLADYLERQMDFCAGFYALGEYWGRL
ncbi:terpene synthase family protein [Sphaerisporangium sp. NPDC004334]